MELSSTLSQRIQRQNFGAVLTEVYLQDVRLGVVGSKEICVVVEQLTGGEQAG